MIKAVGGCISDVCSKIRTESRKSSDRWEETNRFAVCQGPLPFAKLGGYTCLKSETEKGWDLPSVCWCTQLTSSICSSPKVPINRVRIGKTCRGSCVPWLLRASGLTNLHLMRMIWGRGYGIVNSDIPTLLNIKILLKNRDFKNFYTFFQLSIQDFSAAIFYLV